jgi:hypothetical protein
VNKCFTDVISLIAKNDETMTKQKIKPILSGLFILFTLFVISATPYTSIDRVGNDCGLKRLNKLLKADHVDASFKAFIDASVDNIKVFKAAHKIDKEGNDAFVTNVKILELIKTHMGDNIDKFILKVENAGGWAVWKATVSGNSIDNFSYDFLSNIKNWNDTDTDGLKEALKNDPEIAKLFANAIDDAEKIRLAQSWKLLSKFPDKVTPDHITLLYRVADQVKTKSAQGKEALETIFKKIDKYKIGDVLQSLNTADQVFGKIKGAGEKLIAFYDVSIPDIIKVIDGSNNQKKPVCKINNGLLMSSGIKQLHGKDLEVVGHYKEYDIVRNANNELGFKQKSWSDFFVNMEKTSDWNSSYKDELQSFLEDNSNIKKIFNEVLQAPGDLNDVFRIWLILKKNPVAVKSADNFNIILKTKERFVYNQKKGIDGVEEAFDKKDILEQTQIFKGLERANQLFDPLKAEEIKGAFFSIIKENNNKYYVNVSDSKGQICYYDGHKFVQKRGVKSGEVLFEGADYTLLKGDDGAVGFKNGDFYHSIDDQWGAMIDELDLVTETTKKELLAFFEKHKDIKKIFLEYKDVKDRKNLIKNWKKLKEDHLSLCAKPEVITLHDFTLSLLLDDVKKSDELVAALAKDQLAVTIWGKILYGDEIARLNKGGEFAFMKKYLTENDITPDQYKNLKDKITKDGFVAFKEQGHNTQKQWDEFFGSLGEGFRDKKLQQELIAFIDNNKEIKNLFATKTRDQKELCIKNMKKYRDEGYLDICEHIEILTSVNYAEPLLKDLKKSEKLVKAIKSNALNFEVYRILNKDKNPDIRLNKEDEYDIVRQYILDHNLTTKDDYFKLASEINHQGFDIWKKGKVTTSGKFTIGILNDIQTKDYNKLSDPLKIQFKEDYEKSETLRKLLNLDENGIKKWEKNKGNFCAE